MAGAMTADAALADLLEVSDALRSIALFSPDGAVLAEIGQLGGDARGILEAADDAARLLGRPAVHQCEIGLSEALVFAVREHGYAAVAVADPAATAGLVFYDLREALRAIAGDAA
jgi:predicted regulator of Ras-like GTPase activity (Roadblock/LC7/MglB family)